MPDAPSPSPTLPADLRDLVARCRALPPSELVVALRADQARRWRAGQRLLAEAYLAAFPALADSAEDALVLVCGEALLRREAGETPILDDYRARFPQHADTLALQFELQGHLGTLPGDTVRVQGEPPGPDSSPEWPAVPGYEVLGELGRGGMGVVYKARQASLNRTVALKMLLAGPYAGPEEHARFQAEAEAVARLRHPNIVQIFEVGRHAGRPYLVLEYVEGGNLERVLDGTPQNPRAAAALAETIARAVHAAHQQGVVHRDLKPANILLQMSDLKSQIPNLQSAVPKVADFGLAKQMGADAGQTPSRAILGTPSYMAPEQAAGRARSVGPAADVYALGAILYALLTGRPPFRGETPLDTLQQVVSDDPVPPRALQPKVPADLETVCHKCLHKEPARRYASAGDLADDLRRFLAGEPIRARPVGPAGRLWRWCRRKPALAGVTAALVLVAVGAMAGLTALWLRAERHRQVAETRRQEAADDLRLARQAIDKYATKVSEDLRLRQEDLRPLRKELLETVVPLYVELIARHADQPDLQAECGDAYLRLALITREIEDPARAARLFEQAADAFAALAERHPDVSDYQRRLADVRSDLGETYHALDRKGDAEAAFHESLSGWRRLIDDHPGEPDYELGEAHTRIALAWLHFMTRRPADARTEYERALEVADRLGHGPAAIPPRFRRAFAIARHNLGQVYSQGGEPDRGMAELRRAIAADEELLREWPREGDYKLDLSRARAALGDMLWKAGDVTAAEDEFQKSLALGEELARDNPSAVAFLEGLAVARQAHARFYTATRQPSRAAPELRKALDALESLPPAYRDLTRAQERLADAHHDRATALLVVGQYKEAAAESRDAMKLLEGLVERHRGEDSYRADLAREHASLGSAHLGSSEPDKAEAEFKEAVRVADQLAQRHHGETPYLLGLSRAHAELARCYYAQDRKRECEEAFRAALKVEEELDDSGSDVLVTRAKTHNNLAVLYVATKRFKEAGEQYALALDLARRLVAADRHTTEHHVMLGTYYANLGIQQRDTGQLEASLDSFAGAVRALEEVLRREEQHARARFCLVNAHWDRAKALNKLGRAAEALPDWEKALALDDGQRRTDILANRAESRARAGDHARAMAEAEELVAAKDARPDIVYWMGWVCVYASTAVAKDVKLPADERARLAERHAVRGVELLRRAHAAGHFKDRDNLREFQTDHDLDPLRKRPDFQKLLAEVEKQAGTP